MKVSAGTAWLVLGLSTQLVSHVAFAQTQSRPAVELEAAIAKEQVSGDLKTAIAAYQKIAANTAAPRDVRAKALLHLAGCYEKQGQQAQPVYLQIVRDYADQPAAVQANAKLAALQGDRQATSATMTQRKIEVPASLAGFASTFANTDGRHAVYRDRITGALTFGDLATGESRVVFKPKAGVLGRVFASRDMSMAYMELTATDGRLTHAVIRTDGAGYREFPGVFSSRVDWSWDNRYLLACERQPDGSSLSVRVTAADGNILKIGGGRCIQMFSPDGRFIASAEGNGTDGPIFVGPGEGGDQQVVFDNANLMGWTSDGRYLAIAIDRSGSEGLYLLPIRDGQRAGEPVFVRYGAFLIGQTFASGSLVYESTPPGGAYETWLGMFGSDGRLSGWKQWSLSGSNKGLHSPAWSPDNNRIAYVASDHAAGQNTSVILLRNVANGEERELYQGGAGEMFCVWASHHPNLFCGQFTAQGTTEVLSISIESGRAGRLGSVPGKNYFLFGSPDDRAIYMSAPGEELIRWEVATHQSTTLGPGRGSPARWITASPDGRWITQLNRETGNIEIRSVSGGEWRPLVRGGGTQVAFTPDGNWLLYHGVDTAGKNALFRVAATGGQPERIGDFPATTKVGSMWVSPDGRKIIADTQRLYEMWILENFEPKQ